MENIGDSATNQSTPPIQATPIFNKGDIVTFGNDRTLYRTLVPGDPITGLGATFAIKDSPADTLKDAA